MNELLIAELYGKVSPSSPPHERMEDVLTSHVFSLFRYLNTLNLLGDFLAQAHNLSNQSFPIKNLQTMNGIWFWPRFCLPGDTSYRFREGDCFLLVEDETGCKEVMVEAKLDSGLSNLDTADKNIKEQNGFSGHQLVDEYCGLCAGDLRLPSFSRSDERFVLFVTAHYVIPEEEIRQAVDLLGSYCPRCSAPSSNKPLDSKAEETIFWVSWRSLYDILEDHKNDRGYSEGERRLLEDVQKALKVRELRPFRLLTIELKPVGAFDPWYKDEFDLIPVAQYESWFH